MARFISIICPIYNEEKFITGCIDSVLSSGWPHEDMELILVDGMSTDRTCEIIEGYTERYPFIRLLENPHKIVPTAMNIGIAASRGDTIVRIDAHSAYPQGYILKLVNSLNELNADNVGGVLETVPAGETAVHRAIAIAMSHPFGMGDSMFRIGTGKIREVDTVPFGCFKRDVFDRIGMYDEELILNQDDELNGRIIKHGGRIFLVPDVVIEYTARDTIAKMAHMYWGYGLFKPWVNKKLGRAATWRQFVPPLFVAGLIVGVALSFVAWWLFYIYISVLAVYVFTSAAVSIREAVRHRRWQLAFILPWTFFVEHANYGAGYWVGIFTLLCGRNPKFKSKR